MPRASNDSTKQPVDHVNLYKIFNIFKMGDYERKEHRLTALWEEVQRKELNEILSDEGEIGHLSESD
ncbi:hypothetical protein FQA39_LY06005 [Lamprigera yunnana]|nr:hypothetical protein FQA39_LY06005 [Lamprigera yunnana]